MGRDVGIDDAKKHTTKPYEKKTKSKGAAEKELVALPVDRSAFPTEVFPPALQSFVASVATSVQVPVDIPASSALVVAGSAIGATRRFQFRPDWYVGPTLFLAVVAPSGSGKSPALRQVLAPLRLAQKFLLAEYKLYRNLYSELAFDAAQNNQIPPPEPRPPVRLTMDDVTMEALVARHMTNPRGFLVHRDELAGWVRSMDAYRSGRGGDRQRWLSIFDGDPISVDRKSDDEALYLASPTVSLLGSIQPSMLSLLADKELREDGLLPRFIYCYPVSVRDDHDYASNPVPEQHAFFWRHIVLQLINLNFGQEHEAQLITAGKGVEQVYQQWYDASNRELQHPDFSPYLRPVWSKLRIITLRFALILHQLQLAAGEDVDPFMIEVPTMERACLVADWAKQQATAVFGSLHQDKTERQINQLVAWVMRKITPDANGIRKVDIRSIQRARIGGLNSALEVKKLCFAAADRDRGTWDGTFYSLSGGLNGCGGTVG